VRRVVAGRHEGSYFLVEDREADEVLLFQNKIRQGGGGGGGVVELGDFRFAGIPHRIRPIHHQVAGKASLLFVALDIVSVRFAVDLPVQMPQVVTGHVLPVFRELHADPMVGGAMAAREEPLYHQTGSQFQAGYFVQDPRIQIL